MLNPSVERRIRLLTEFYMDYSGDEAWVDFIESQDLGLPAAVLVYNGGATLTEIGEEFVNSTWDALCNVLSKDPSGDYNEIEDLIMGIEFE